MTQEPPVETELLQRDPIRTDNRPIQLTTAVISLAIMITWSVLANLSLDLIITMVVVAVILIGLAMSRYSVRVIQESSDHITFIRPGISWSLASQSILGGSVVIATIFFFVNTSVTPSELLKILILSFGVIFTFLMCPGLLLLTTVHPTWLKTIIRAQLVSPFSLSIERACMFDRNALLAQQNHALVEPIEDYLRSRFELT
ncbi:MAG: hypothetical protein K9W43_06090 [Candidatus Thorarchaeota archaeon]|nr:hypothetical protein [Candidatus Thorarchaeota archaeon]